MLGAKRRMEREWEARRWSAWYTAALPYFKKFPSFDDFVDVDKPQKSPDELLQVARMITHNIQEAG